MLSGRSVLVGPSARARAWAAWALPLLVSLSLAGCGLGPASHAPPGTDADTAGSGGSDADPGADAPADPSAGMVAAVTPGGDSTDPLSVKFRIEARPMVGSPVKIMIAVVPASAAIDHLHGSFLPSDGLSLQSGRSFDIGSVQAGSTLYREVTVVPMQSGVLSLSATILVGTDKSSQSRTYSIPLIASDSSS